MVRFKKVQECPISTIRYFSANPAFFVVIFFRGEYDSPAFFPALVGPDVYIEVFVAGGAGLAQLSGLPEDVLQ